MNEIKTNNQNIPNFNSNLKTNLTTSSNTANKNITDIKLNPLSRFDTNVENIFKEFQLSISSYNNFNYLKAEESINISINNLNNIFNHEKLKGNSLSRRKHKDILLECSNLLERSKKKFSQKQNIGDVNNYFTIENRKTNLYAYIVDSREYDKLSDEYYISPVKLLSILASSIETGSFITENLNIRKEIWNQGSAKLNYLNQKHEAFHLIYQKIDNLSTLAVKGVINSSNFDKFCDVLIDIQNSFSKEIPTILPNRGHDINKDTQQNTFHKKFSDFSAKIQTNLFTIKISDKPDYFEIILKLIKKLNELKLIYSEVNKTYGNKTVLMSKKSAISNFLYNFLFKLVFTDLQELTNRFLKKKIISFEEK